jgi:hypothetical protein
MRTIYGSMLMGKYNSLKEMWRGLIHRTSFHKLKQIWKQTQKGCIGSRIFSTHYLILNMLQECPVTAKIHLKFHVQTKPTSVSAEVLTVSTRIKQSQQRTDTVVHMENCTVTHFIQQDTLRQNGAHCSVHFQNVHIQ